MVHLINFENTQLPIISVIIHWRLSLPESPYCDNTTFKKNSICLSRRGHRLAWSRIPSLLKLHYIISLRYWPGALAVVGSNPTGPIDQIGS